VSSILKALEKVEEERSGRKRDLTSLPKSRQRVPAWILPTSVVGGAAVAALATFSAMGGFSRKPAPPPSPVPVALPAPAAAGAAHKQTAAVPVHGKAGQGRVAQRTMPPRHTAKAQPRRKEEPVPVIGPSPVPALSLPPIRVTGIAWQKERVSSAAIVNGRPVAEGEMVDGCRVEQIHQDKVTFAGGGRKFDVPLGGGE